MQLLLCAFYSHKISFELQIFQGESVNIFRRIINKHPKLNLNANYQVEPYCIKRDEYIKDLGKRAREKAQKWDWENKTKELEHYFENAK